MFGVVSGTFFWVGIRDGGEGGLDRITVFLQEQHLGFVYLCLYGKRISFELKELNGGCIAITISRTLESPSLFSRGVVCSPHGSGVVRLFFPCFYLNQLHAD